MLLFGKLFLHCFLCQCHNRHLSQSTCLCWQLWHTHCTVKQPRTAGRLCHPNSKGCLFLIIPTPPLWVLWSWNFKNDVVSFAPPPINVAQSEREVNRLANNMRFNAKKAVLRQMIYQTQMYYLVVGRHWVKIKINKLHVSDFVINVFGIHNHILVPKLCLFFPIIWMVH